MRYGTFLFVLILSGCAITPFPDSHAQQLPVKRITLSDAQMAKLAQRIWKNECAGTVSGLTTWNKGEYFASLGIGHFIWYSESTPGPFEESFPPLIQFMKARNVQMPAWVAAGGSCPWTTRAEFEAARNSAKMISLRHFLKNTISHQMVFIVQRLERALPKMLASADPSKRKLVHDRFYAVAETPQGVYALVDYINFKGEGTNPKERYKGQGWGMLQVLEEMRGSPRGVAAAVEYSQSARRVLGRRILNAPGDESRWKAGWFNRCDSYAKPF